MREQEKVNLNNAYLQGPRCGQGNKRCGVKVVNFYSGQVACLHVIEEISTGPWFDYWPRLRFLDGATGRDSRNSGQGTNLSHDVLMHNLYGEKTRLLSRSNWQEV